MIIPIVFSTYQEEPVLSCVSGPTQLSVAELLRLSKEGPDGVHGLPASVSLMNWICVVALQDKGRENERQRDGGGVGGGQEGCLSAWSDGSTSQNLQMCEGGERIWSRLGEHGFRWCLFVCLCCCLTFHRRSLLMATTPKKSQIC